MKNKLQIAGTQNFMEKDIPIVLGGFGPNKKCISDKTIAEIHGMKPIHVRELIGRNLVRFRESIDYVDLAQCIGENDTLELLASLGYAKQSITQAEHIFILSERGYAKLIKIMDTDKAWEIHDKLMDEYFALRDGAYMSLRDVEEALLSPDTIIRLATELKEERAQRVLLEEKSAVQQKQIEEQKPMVEFAEKVGNTKDLITISQMAKLVHDENIPIGRNKLFQWLREKKILRENNEPYQQYVTAGCFEVKETTKDTTYGPKVFPITLVTGKGQMHIVERLRKEFSTTTNHR